MGENLASADKVLICLRESCFPDIVNALNGIDYDVAEWARSPIRKTWLSYAQGNINSRGALGASMRSHRKTCFRLRKGVVGINAQYDSGPLS